ncbi:MAG TPA: hypothetical protein VKN73_03940 [Desulfosalsimonadaceae bacterium]|nr:hypothetical protein [Desulfosalsimonadaceae bacterium]
MKKRSIALCLTGVLVLAGLGLSACSFKEKLPDTAVEMHGKCTKIDIGPGPEDFVLDKWQHPAPRFLISSCERREPTADGDIFFYVPETRDTGIMRRTGEPARLAAFRPHGIDIRHADGTTHLYVILHDPYESGGQNKHAVAVYRVFEDQLSLVNWLEDANYLWSPNDLSVMKTGDIYLTNDYRGKLDLYFKRKASEIALYDADTEKWRIVADSLAFANGILAEPDQVFVTTTLGNQVLAYPRRPDGSLGQGEAVASLKGGDNLTRYGKYLITAAHFDDFAFLRHAKDSEKPAPTVVMRITPETGMKKPIYVNSGEFISAASTAMVYKDKIYISQVFDPFMVVCDAPPDIDW